MDSSGMPFSRIGPQGARNDARSTTRTTATTHSNPMMPAVITAAPSVYPQAFPVVNQHAQAVYIGATNYFQPAPSPQRHILPQTFYNPTVRTNGDASEARFVYIAVSNQAANSERIPPRPPVAYVERNQMIPSYTYRSNSQAAVRSRPPPTTTTMGQTIQTNGIAIPVNRPISVHWPNPGNNNVPQRPSNASQGKSTSPNSSSVVEKSDIGGSTSVVQSAVPETKQKSSALAIPVQQIYPANDPRLIECGVEIPSKVAASEKNAQRDPRPSIIVPRILARFTGSHGSIPPTDPRSHLPAAEAKVSKDVLPPPVTTTQATEPPKESATAQRVSQPEVQSDPVPPTESQSPQQTAPLQTAIPVKGKARTKVVPRLSDLAKSIPEQDRITDVGPVEPPVEQSDPRSVIIGDTSPIPDKDLANEREACSDEETDSEGSCTPEDPRQNRTSRAMDDAAHERDTSPTQDLAEDPRLGSLTPSDRRRDGEQNKSVYIYVPGPSVSSDQSRSGECSESASGGQCPETDSRDDAETTKMIESTNGAEVSHARNSEEIPKEALVGSFSSFVKSELSKMRRAGGEVKQCDRTGPSPEKRKRGRPRNAKESDDSKSSPPKKQHTTETRDEEQIKLGDASRGMPEEALPPQLTDSASCGEPRIATGDKPVSTKSGKPRAKRRGADKASLSANNILPSTSRKRKKPALFSSSTGGEDSSRRGPVRDDSDSDSGNNNDIKDSVLKVIEKRRRVNFTSQSHEDTEEDANTAQEVDSSAWTGPSPPNEEPVEQRSEKLNETPARSPLKNRIDPQGGADERGGHDRPDQLSSIEPIVPSEPPVSSVTFEEFNADISRCDPADASSPSTIMDARLQSDEEEELREKHERGNAQLVYEKVCEFQRAFELSGSCVRVRDDQMTIVGILDDILKMFVDRRNSEPANAVQAEEPKKIPDAVTSHKDESVKKTQTEEQYGERREVDAIRSDGNTRTGTNKEEDEDKKRKADEKNTEDEKRKRAGEKKIEDERRKKADNKKILDDREKKSDEKRTEDERRKKEAEREVDAKKEDEKKKQEEKKKQDEEKKKEGEKKKQEEKKKRKEDEKRKQEEKKKKEMEKKKQEETRKKEDEKKKQGEKKKHEKQKKDEKERLDEHENEKIDGRDVEEERGVLEERDVEEERQVGEQERAMQRSQRKNSSPEILTVRRKRGRPMKVSTNAHEEARTPSIAELLEPYKDLQNLWSPYLDDESSQLPVPVIVLQDIHLGPSTTRRLRMKASDIRKREQICELCPFVSLNTLSLEKHVESFHAGSS